MTKPADSDQNGARAQLEPEHDSFTEWEALCEDSPQTWEALLQRTDDLAAQSELRHTERAP